MSSPKHRLRREGIVRRKVRVDAVLITTGIIKPTLAKRVRMDGTTKIVMTDVRILSMDINVDPRVAVVMRLVTT